MAGRKLNMMEGLKGTVEQKVIQARTEGRNILSTRTCGVREEAGSDRCCASER